MKPQPYYRSPFAAPGIYESVSRQEAAQLFRQWRRNGAIVRMKAAARGYLFRGKDGEGAALVLK